MNKICTTIEQSKKLIELGIKPESADIKEVANEYAKDYLFSTKPQRAPNVHFETGANYVIKQIENILSYPLKYVHSDKSVEEGMIADIVNIVKQLKGE